MERGNGLEPPTSQLETECSFSELPARVNWLTSEDSNLNFARLRVLPLDHW